MNDRPTHWMLGDAKPAEEDRKTWWTRLPRPPDKSANAPGGYEPPDGLLDAFNSAIALGQPLLITGEPGCGKTEAANYLAYRMGLEHPHSREAALRFDVKSTTGGRDLFYSFDLIDRFTAQQLGDPTDPELFVRLNAFGQAIVEASPASDDAAQRLRQRLFRDASAKPRRCVVLIDEIDKAPRETPNDLLVEIEKLQFHVPEMRHTFVADPAFRPLVVMTSNSERALPDAFLRRCVFHVMKFPEDKLATIVTNRLGAIDSQLRDDGVGLLKALRASRLNRLPGTAELLSFFRTLKDTGLAGGGLRGRTDWTGFARSTLIKNAEDQQRLDDAQLHALVPQA